MKKEPNLAEAKKVLHVDKDYYDRVIDPDGGELVPGIVVTPGETYTLSVKVEG